MLWQLFGDRFRSAVARASGTQGKIEALEQEGVRLTRECTERDEAIRSELREFKRRAGERFDHAGRKTSDLASMVQSLATAEDVRRLHTRLDETQAQLAGLTALVRVNEARLSDMRRAPD